jgi:hypothetical protein
MEEIRYVGVIIGENGIPIDLNEVRGFHNWETPEKRKEVQAF